MYYVVKLLVHLVSFMHTCTQHSISSVAIVTLTGEAANSVGTISIDITWFKCTLINVCKKKIREKRRLSKHAHLYTTKAFIYHHKLIYLHSD